MLVHIFCYVFRGSVCTCVAICFFSFDQLSKINNIKKLVTFVLLDTEQKNIFRSINCDDFSLIHKRVSNRWKVFIIYYRDKLLARVSLRLNTY